MITKVKLDDEKLKVKFTNSHSACHNCYFNSPQRECPVRREMLLCRLLNNSESEHAYFVKESKK